MNEYELGLTQSAAENEQETFETLMTAAREIAQSQEQDFQALKDRPWYKSLLKTLTFSNSSEQKKLLAKDISSLSKLNEITWRALYLLSKSSANMAAQIEQNAANIEQLLRQQGVLFDSVKRIVEQVINAQSRSRRKSSLQSLTEQNRNLFAGTLYTLSKQMPEQPEFARQYLSRLLPVLNIHAPEDDIAPEELETLSRMRNFCISCLRNISCSRAECRSMNWTWPKHCLSVPDGERKSGRKRRNSLGNLAQTSSLPISSRTCRPIKSVQMRSN